MNEDLFRELERITSRPEPFEFYTASELWTDEYTSQRMLEFHLNKEIDVASRNAEFIKRSVNWIESHFQIEPSSKIADFGCGPGLYSIELAKRGAVVTGIDFSAGSIGFARETAEKEGVEVNFINGNYLDYESDECFDLILLLMCDLCALSPKQRRLMLSKFRKLLKKGGAILLDVYSLNAFDKREEAAVFEENLLNGFWAPDKYFGFQNTFKYDIEKVMLDKYTITEASRTRTVYNWLQYFSLSVLKNEFADCGLEIAEVYNDVAGSAIDEASDEFAVVAIRKDS